MLVSGRITRKSVKSGTYGDKVSFLVGGNWLSAFASDKKLDQDAKDLLRSLVEGEEAEFTIVEAPNKNDPAKPYLNIAGIIKVNRVDVPADGRVEISGVDFTKPGAKLTVHELEVANRQVSHEPGGLREKTMLAAYAKDAAISHCEHDVWTTESFIEYFDSIYDHLIKKILGE